jgi:hypothetical protein
MSTKSLVVTALGAATVVAVGAGSFIALRMNAANRPVAAETAAPVAGLVDPGQAPVPPAVIGTSVAVEPPASPAEPAVPSKVEAPTKAEAARKAPAAASNSQAPAEIKRNAPRQSSPAPAAPAPRVTTAPPVGEPAPAVTNAPATQSTSATVPAATIPPSDPPATVTPDPLPPPPPAKPRFEELTVGENAVIGIRLETALSSATAKIEDRVTARVSRDVTVEGRTAIPAGARLEGTVVTVEKGGKFKDRARLGVRFTSVVLSDNMRVPIQTETIFRDGDSPAPDATSKIGASAVVGAILGAVIGGKKGAAIGGSAGAAGGTAVVMNGDGNPATMAAGSPLTVRLTAPVTVTIDKEQNK